MPRALLSSFPVITTLPIQWGEHDAFDHVNNVVYFRWFETARVVYLQRVGLWRILPEGLGPILAHISCNYRRPLTFPDTIHIGARVIRIGRSSFKMEHTIVSESFHEPVADSESTIVVFDYNKQHAIRMPDRFRLAIEALEGRSLQEVK